MLNLFVAEKLLMYQENEFSYNSIDNNYLKMILLSYENSVQSEALRLVRERFM